jgi:hypothetical protein
MLELYKPGEYLKVEITDEITHESEWLWVEISLDDPANRLVFGTIDNEPIASPGIRRGMEVAVSYDNIREHRTAASSRSD